MDINNLIVKGEAKLLGSADISSTIKSKIVTINCDTTTQWANTYRGFLNVTSLFGENIEYVISVNGYGNYILTYFSPYNPGASYYTIWVYKCGGSGNVQVQVTAKVTDVLYPENP